MPGDLPAIDFVHQFKKSYAPISIKDYNFKPAGGG
jgi:hypothetical protein